MLIKPKEPEPPKNDYEKLRALAKADSAKAFDIFEKNTNASIHTIRFHVNGSIISVPASVLQSSPEGCMFHRLAREAQFKHIRPIWLSAISTHHFHLTLRFLRGELAQLKEYVKLMPVSEKETFIYVAQYFRLPTLASFIGKHGGLAVKKSKHPKAWDTPVCGSVTFRVGQSGGEVQVEWTDMWFMPGTLFFRVAERRSETKDFERPESITGKFWWFFLLRLDLSTGGRVIEYIEKERLPFYDPPSKFPYNITDKQYREVMRHASLFGHSKMAKEIPGFLVRRREKAERERQSKEGKEKGAR